MNTVSKKELFAFGFISIPMSMGAFPIAMYLTPYYTQEFGFSLATIGVILMLTRISDVVTDPLIGTLSDRTPVRYGRRGLWIVIGAPILAISIVAVFDPFTESPTTLYLFCAIACLYLGWTLIGIPLSAWGAEISDNYHERSRITGVRAWGGITGQITAVLTPLIIIGLVALGYDQFKVEREGSLQPMLRILAWSSLVILIIATFALIKTLRQPVFETRSRIEIIRGLKLIFKNSAFLRLLASNIFAAIGLNAVSTLFVFFVTLYLLADSTQWPLIMLVWMVGQFIGTPIIILVAPRFNKHRMFACCSLLSIAAFSLIFFFDPGDIVPFMVLNFFTGMLAPVNSILSPSMAADVIDQDTLVSGEQRGALFMSLWGMGDKLAIAAAAGISLPLMQYLGFDPNVENDGASLQVLHYAFIVFPVIFFCASIACIWNYPITREVQVKTHADLSAMGLTASAKQ